MTGKSKNTARDGTASLRCAPSMRIIRSASKAHWCGVGAGDRCGSGNLRDALPNAVSIDVQWTPWLDVVADAHTLPFEAGSFANVVMLDVFHHLSYPTRFLREAMRVLRPGGRLVMIEPNVSIVSWVLFKLLHEEPVLLGEDPFDSTPRSGRPPMKAIRRSPISSSCARCKN